MEPDRLIKKELTHMLCLALAQGEYLTIGGDVVVQFDRMSADRCKLLIEAPREVPILRGEVLERGGGERPSCVFDSPRYSRGELSWNRSKAQALTAMRALLSQMDGSDSNVRTLRRQLNHIFPPEQGGPEISNG